MKIEKTKEEMQEFYKKHQKENQEESLNKVQSEQEIQRKEFEKKQKEIELKKEKQVRVSNEFTNIAKQLLLKFIDLEDDQKYMPVECENIIKEYYKNWFNNDKDSYLPESQKRVINFFKDVLLECKKIDIAEPVISRTYLEIVKKYYKEYEYKK